MFSYAVPAGFSKLSAASWGEAVFPPATSNTHLVVHRPAEATPDASSGAAHDIDDDADALSAGDSAESPDVAADAAGGRRVEAAQVAAEWGFKDPATAAAMLRRARRFTQAKRSRQHKLDPQERCAPPPCARAWSCRLVERA